jgi:hypothetical protein
MKAFSLLSYGYNGGFPTICFTLTKVFNSASKCEKICSWMASIRAVFRVDGKSIVPNFWARIYLREIPSWVNKTYHPSHSGGFNTAHCSRSNMDGLVGLIESTCVVGSSHRIPPFVVLSHYKVLGLVQVASATSTLPLPADLPAHKMSGVLPGDWNKGDLF